MKLSKNINKTITDMSNDYVRLSKPLQILKKKSVTFKKHQKKLTGHLNQLSQTFIYDKCSTVICQRSKVNQFGSKEVKTCLTLNGKWETHQAKHIEKTKMLRKVKNENFISEKPQFPMRSKLLLSMFNDENKQNIESSNQIPGHTQQNTLQNSSFQKPLLQNSIHINPFQVVERQIQKKRQIKKVKSYSRLQNLSKRLLKQLNVQAKYDSQSNLMRRRYVSYFHTKSKTNQNKFQFPNRRTIQKSHLRTQPVDYSVGLKNQQIKDSTNYCMKLIQYCKVVQNQQKIKKQLDLFTTYSRDFQAKCQRKYKYFNRMNKKDD